MTGLLTFASPSTKAYLKPACHVGHAMSGMPCLACHVGRAMSGVPGHNHASHTIMPRTQELPAHKDSSHTSMPHTQSCLPLTQHEPLAAPNAHATSLLISSASTTRSNCCSLQANHMPHRESNQVARFHSGMTVFISDAFAPAPDAMHPEPCQAPCYAPCHLSLKRATLD